jgi:hypothetical protein
MAPDEVSITKGQGAALSDKPMLLTGASGTIGRLTAAR